MAPSVGILALQGCIEPHIQMLHRIGISAVKVRLPEDLKQIDRIILPGGESTTMLSMLERVAMFDSLHSFGMSNPVWGICAGSILIAKEVVHPTQKSLGLINVRATRNHYGSQLESFKAQIQVAGLNRKFEVDFIRAPLLEPLDENIEVLARNKEQTVLLRKGNILASAFHTELGSDPWMHEMFCGL